MASQTGGQGQQPIINIEDVPELKTLIDKLLITADAEGITLQQLNADVQGSIGQQQQQPQQKQEANG